MAHQILKKAGHYSPRLFLQPPSLCPGHLYIPIWPLELIGQPLGCTTDGRPFFSIALIRRTHFSGVVFDDTML